MSHAKPHDSNKTVSDKTGAIQKPLKGDAWLVRDIDGKMRRGIFFVEEYAENFKEELDRISMGNCREVVKIRLQIDTKYYEKY